MHISRVEPSLSFSALTLLVGRQEGHLAKIIGCWFVGDDLTGAMHVRTAPVVTTCIILSSNKIENAAILIPDNPGPRGKWPLNQRERERGDREPYNCSFRGACSYMNGLPRERPRQCDGQIGDL